MRLFLLANTVLTTFFFSEASGAFPNEGILHSPADLSFADHVLLARNAASDQVTSKIVITERKPRGEEMEIRYRVEFDNVPHGKKYRLYLLTGYMQKNGLPEIDVSKQFGLFIPDSRGRIVHGYGFVLYRGEWVRMRLRSVDGSIEKVFQFTLFK
jgi:hypothetical protein